MCGDIYSINEDIKMLEKENIDYLHIDLMDGHFVSNLGLGIDFIRNLRKHTYLPFDFHLMVENPEKIIPMLNITSSDIVSIHFESTYHINETIDILKEYNCKLFLALNPETPVIIVDLIYEHIDGVNFMTVHPGFAGQKILEASFKKFKRLQELVQNKDRKIILEVDGNMTFENAKLFSKLGAQIFVAGTSSIFPNHKLNADLIKKFREYIVCCNFN